jgi:hypothetical protein
MSEPAIGYDQRWRVTIAGLLGALKFALRRLVGIVALIAIPVLLNAFFGLDLDSMFWIVVGITLATLTILRPWWFWNHPKVIALRGLITDRGVTSGYLVFAALGIVGGAWRQAAITSARNDCIAALARAKDTHERFQILFRNGASNLPRVGGGTPRSIICEKLLEPR